MELDSYLKRKGLSDRELKHVRKLVSKDFRKYYDYGAYALADYLFSPISTSHIVDEGFEDIIKAAKENLLK